MRATAAAALLLAALATAAAAAATPPVCQQWPSEPPAAPELLFSAPADLGLHRSEYETVWYVGTVRDEAKNASFGLVVLLLRQGNSAAECATDPLALVASSVSLADVGANTFASEWAVVRPTSGSPAPRIGAGLWSLDASPGAWRNETLAVSAPLPSGGSSFKTSLALQSHGPLLGMANRGVLKSSNISHGTMHLARSNMTVQGELVARGGEVFTVSGSLWMQQMFNSLPPGGPRLSWHWFFFRLSDGYAYQLVLMDAPYEDLSYVNQVPPELADGAAAAAAAPQYPLAPGRRWSVDGSRPWTSAASGHTYNTTNRIQCPELELDLEISTLILDNEVPITSSFHFYEGASTVRGTHLGSAVTGDAFTERVLPVPAGAAPSPFRRRFG